MRHSKVGIVGKDDSRVAIDRLVVLSRRTGQSTDRPTQGLHALWKESVSARAQPPVIVGAEQVLREAGGPVSGCIPRGIPRQGGKVVALGCIL